MTAVSGTPAAVAGGRYRADRGESRWDRLPRFGERDVTQSTRRHSSPIVSGAPFVRKAATLMRFRYIVLTRLKVEGTQQPLAGSGVNQTKRDSKDIHSSHNSRPSDRIGIWLPLAPLEKASGGNKKFFAKKPSNRRTCVPRPHARVYL